MRRRSRAWAVNLDSIIYESRIRLSGGDTQCAGYFRRDPFSLHNPMNAQQALQRIEATPPPAPVMENPMTLLALAVEKGADVGTLERLAMLRDKFMAERAKQAYFDALAAFQSECPIILRSRAGHENRYNYAPLEKIVEKVKPYLQKHGFSHQEDANVTEGWVEASVTVTHREGHSEVKKFKVPAESRAGMSPAQKYGAAMTYATRYAFCAAFGIRTADRDTDCGDDTGDNVTALRKQLWEVCKPIRGLEQKWDTARQWLTDECNMDPGKRVNDLDADELKSLIRKAGELLPGRGQ